MKTPLTLAALALVAFGLAACKKDPPPAPPPAASEAPAAAATEQPAAEAAASTVAVAAANLGSTIGNDKKIAAPSETFAKTDTIYLSVETSGAGQATIKAKWIYKDKDGTPTTVTEGSQTINPSAPVAIDFSVSKPDGWPLGDYQVEISLNDTIVQTKLFSVK